MSDLKELVEEIKQTIHGGKYQITITYSVSINQTSENPNQDKDTKELRKNYQNIGSIVDILTDLPNASKFNQDESFEDGTATITFETDNLKTSLDYLFSKDITPTTIKAKRVDFDEKNKETYEKIERILLDHNRTLYETRSTKFEHIFPVGLGYLKAGEYGPIYEARDNY